MKNIFGFLIAFLLLINTCYAKPGWEQKIPPQLKPWLSWVTRDFEQSRCPHSYQQYDNRECLWQSMLSLDLTSEGGNFKYNISADDESDISLPGKTTNWPQSVTVNGQPAVVLNRNGLPVVHLSAGAYVLEGRFFWAILPDSFAVPEGLAILNLSVNGKKQLFPNISQNIITLNNNIEESVKTDIDRLDLKVFRKFEDSLPARIDTKVRLEISGKPREISLNQLRLPGFSISDISSPLPVGIDQRGNISVQIRAGSYLIETTSYSSKELSEISFSSGDNWAASELWSFAANPALRVVDLEGASAIDPKLYDIPLEWQQLNAYRIEPGQILKIIERKRGEAKQASDQLTLNRTIKLNFDGRGFSVFDNLSGNIADNKHFGISADYQLNSVSINNVDQLISQVKGSDSGVEVRSGNINLIASSQVENKDGLLFPGWQTDFNSIQTSLYLPPGWQLFHIWGTDYVQGSWFARWSLLDVFLVMLTVIAALKVFDWKVALLSLAALLLFEKSLFSITWIVLVIIGFSALLIFVKSEKYSSRIKHLKTCLLGITFLLVLNAVADDLKHAIHPQLNGLYFDQRPTPQTYQNYMPAAAPEPGAIAGSYNDEISYKGLAEGGARDSYTENTFDSSVSKFASRAKKEYVPAERQLYQNNIDQAVQTGKGVSNWRSSRSYAFGWNTPVVKDQTVKFMLISPQLNIVFAFLRAILIFLLLIRLMFNSFKFNLPSVKILFLLTLSLPLISAGNIANAEDSKPAHDIEINNRLLDELAVYAVNNLNEQPKCLPNCADLSDFDLNLQQNKFTLGFKIHVAESVFFTLPFNRRDFSVDTIAINGSSENIKIKTLQDRLLVVLKSGISDLKITGTVSERETINLTFPVVPHHGKFSAQGWTVSGIDKNGVVDSVLSLSREQKEIVKEQNFQAKPLKLSQQFLVSRTINLEYDAKISTNITRLSPADSGMDLEYNLLPGESVITPGVEVLDGKVKIAFKTGETEKNYLSLLNASDQIQLTSAENLLWNEVWYLNASNLWHFEYSGTPRIYLNQETPEWHPRPGENLLLKLEKPIGVNGSTKTVETLNLSGNLGKEIQIYNLTFTLKSSKGEIHRVDLPQDAEIVSVKLNNLAQSFTPGSSAVDLNLTPGRQNVNIEWRGKQELGGQFAIGQVKLNAPVANMNFTYSLPQSIWVLFTGGASYGPAVLFWGYFPVALLLAFGLSFIKTIPLKLYQWFLLLIGMSQVDFLLNSIVILWFILLSLRSKSKLPASSLLFPLMQISLALWSIFAFNALYSAIETGLLGSPRMMIAGNGSSSFQLKWYHDLSDSVLSSPWFIGLDIWYYRALMLLWALWLASSVITWIKWGFESYSQNGLWYQKKVVSAKSEQPKA